MAQATTISSSAEPCAGDPASRAAPAEASTTSCVTNATTVSGRTSQSHPASTSTTLRSVRSCFHREASGRHDASASSCISAGPRAMSLRRPRARPSLMPWILPFSGTRSPVAPSVAPARPCPSPPAIRRSSPVGHCLRAGMRTPGSVSRARTTSSTSASTSGDRWRPVQLSQRPHGPVAVGSSSWRRRNSMRHASGSGERLLDDAPAPPAATSTSGAPFVPAASSVVPPAAAPSPSRS